MLSRQIYLGSRNDSFTNLLTLVHGGSSTIFGFHDRGKRSASSAHRHRTLIALDLHRNHVAKVSHRKACPTGSFFAVNSYALS